MGMSPRDHEPRAVPERGGAQEGDVRGSVQHPHPHKGVLDRKSPAPS